MRGTLKLLLASLAVLLALGCDDPEPDGDADGDADLDADADGDGGECPMNSGVPCVCDRPFTGSCADGSSCIALRNLGATELGFCSESCDCGSYDEPCSATRYPAVSSCIMASDWPITEASRCNCLLVECEDAGDCPPMMDCLAIERTQGEHAGETVGVCHP